MIEIENLIPGKEYWCSYIEFSKSGTRVNRRIIPQKVRYESLTEGIYSNRIGVLKPLGSNQHLFYIYNNQEFFEYVYKTEEEAIEGFNSMLYNVLDKVRSEYDSKVNKINKCFIKKG